MTRAAAVVLLMALAGPVLAQPAADGLAYAPPEAPAAPAVGGLLLRLVGLTLLGLAGCAAVLAASRRGRWAARPNAAGTGRLAHVAATTLDRRCTLHLIRVGARQVVLGVDGGGLKEMVLLPESFAGLLADEGPFNG